MNTNRLLEYSLRSKPWGKKVVRILAAGLEAVNPRTAVLNHFSRVNDSVKINGETINLSSTGRIFVIGAGKAGQPMADAVAEVLGDDLYEGLIIVKEGYLDINNHIDGINIFEAGHPIPDQRGVLATHNLIKLTKQICTNDLVICLLSGGGSALMIAPIEGVSLAEIQDLTTELLASGATINEINTLRKHLDQVKGGQIARYVHPANLISLVLSDVVGDPLDVIASGPTVPDTSTFEDAFNILLKYQIEDRISGSIIEHLKTGIAGGVPDTPKGGDRIFENVSNHVIGSNFTAAQGALKQAIKEGFNSILLTNYLQGEAKVIGRALAAIIRQLASKHPPLERPACIILGGETTVTIEGTGMGGRNQELALASIEDLAGLQDIALISLATDGGDGPTNAAGAVVTGDSYHRALELNINPLLYLRNNDSHNFFKALDDLVITGPTQTNVNDLVFLFAF